MVVQHNLQAMNSNRMLNITNNGLAKSTEKLASGYRINRAADDAAGLAISEKMRKQIRGLEQASANAQDGISCVQTAEGALAEVEDMLQRMNQLTVQAANGTNSVSDRENIQDEIDQLVSEIDRIAETSKFNETYLLKGATDGSVQTLGQYSYKEYTATTMSWDYDLTAISIYTDENCTVTIADDATIGEFLSIEEDGDVTIKGKIFAKNTYGEIYEILDPNSLAAITYVDELDNVYDESNMPPTGIKLKEDARNKYFILNEDGTRKYITDGNIEDYMKIVKGAPPSVTINNAHEIKYVNTLGEVVDIGDTGNLMAPSIAEIKTDEPMLYDAEGNRISANGLAKIMTSESAIYELFLNTGQSLQEIGITNDTLRDYVKITEESYPDKLEVLLQVGSDGNYENKLPVEIESMDSVNLGVDILSSKKNGIVDEDGQLATDAIDVIATAINKVSAQRASLGAIQNRLEHTINNLDNVAENTTAAESSIRDTDMATEMVRYSNTNILAQAGQSMLAQANQANQGVLSLLGQ